MSLAQITNNACRLALFIQNNKAIKTLPVSNFRAREIEHQIPSKFNFIDQINNLNRQIKEYCEQQIDQGGYKMVLTGYRHNLENSLVQPTATLADLSRTLKQISHFEQSLIQVRPHSPLSPLNQQIPLLSNDQPLPFSSASSLSSMDEDVSSMDMDEDVRAENVDDETNRILRERDREIFHRQSEKLEVVDGLIAFLNRNNEDPYKVWKTALEESDPVLFDTFPGLVEGRMIQRLAPYKAYSEVLTRGEYEQIKALKFDELAKEMGKDFDPSQDLSPLFVKLKLLGKANRQQNERLVSLGISRQAEVLRQRSLFPQIGTMSPETFSNELSRSLESESVTFLSRVLDHHIDRVSREDQNKIAVWLASRGRNDLLNLLSNLSERIYFRAMAEAELWGHNDTYNLLFGLFTHDRTEAREALLIGLAYEGLKRGIEHLLSPSYNHVFSPQIINKAFLASLNKGHFGSLASFFNAGVLPFDATLQKAYSEICKSSQFEFLEPFFKSEILLKIPEASAILTQEFKSFCSSENFDHIDFFLKPEVSALFDADCPALLIQSILYSELEWDEKELLLQKFVLSPLFNQLSKEEFLALVNDVAKSGETKIARFLLRSKRGHEIQQPEFEQILTDTADLGYWDTVTNLIDMAGFQAFNEPFLNLLLAKTAEEGTVGLLEKILSKNAQLNINEAFKSAAQKGKVPSMKVLLNRNPRLPLGDLENLLDANLKSQRMDVVSLLILIPGILEVCPALVSQILIEGARSGQSLLLSLVFENLKDVPDPSFTTALFAALGNQHIPSAEKLCSLRPGFILDRVKLEAFATQAAEAGKKEVLQFLFRHFREQMQIQIAEAAYTAAEAKGKPEASAYLWHMIWHSYAKRTADLNARPAKRLHH